MAQKFLSQSKNPWKVNIGYKPREGEINGLERNSIWEIVNKPRVNRTVGCKWIFTVKYKVDETIDK